MPCSFSTAKVRARLVTRRHRHEFGGAGRHFAHHAIHRGGHDPCGMITMCTPGRIGGAQAGAQIVRIGDPVEHQQQGIAAIRLNAAVRSCSSHGLSGRTAATAP